MAGLDYLTQGGAGATNGNTVQQYTLPDWYNSYIQGIAAKATDIASNPYQAYPGARLADFNDDQRLAFDKVRANQGVANPNLDAAGDLLSGATGRVQGALGQVGGFGTAAVDAVGGPAANWTDPGVADKYMSPYTKNVVDEIGRLGNRNITENILPSVQSSFTGAGQFGSTRNADILGQYIRDAQVGITGEQSKALQAGYTGAAGIFAGDANRTQQQGSLQAQTNLGAGNMNVTAARTGADTASQLATQQGALGQLKQSTAATDASALGAIGGAQQGLEQQGYDKSYQNFLTQQGWDWQQLGKVQGAVTGAQLPTGSSGSTSQTSTPAGTSPLAWVNALGGLYNAYTGSQAPAPAPAPAPATP